MYCSTDEVREIGTQMTDGIKSSSSPTLVSDETLEEMIERASRIFDLVCGARPEYFEASADGATATTRTFYGDGTNLLRVDPYVPGSLDTTITLPDGYTAPTFAERDGYLILASNGILPPFAPSVFPGGWNRGVPVTISAKWGYEATPADVKAAVVELVINLWRETDPVSAKLVNIDGAQLREKLPPRVAEIARQYRMKVAEVIFA